MVSLLFPIKKLAELTCECHVGQKDEDINNDIF